MPDQPLDPSRDPNDAIKRAYEQTQVQPISAIQVAFTRLTWVVVMAILLAIGFIALVWWSKLPPVPPVTATPEEMAQYRDLTDIAKRL